MPDMLDAGLGVRLAELEQAAGPAAGLALEARIGKMAATRADPLAPPRAAATRAEPGIHGNRKQRRAAAAAARKGERK